MARIPLTSAVSDVQLVPDPGGGMALGVALGADIAGPHRSASICGRFIVSCRSSRLGSFACSSPLRGRPRLRRRFGFAAFGFGAGFSRASNRRRIPRDVLHQMAIHRPRRSASHADGSQALSANSEKARENVASLGSRPAPLQPHSRHSLPSTSRRSIRPRVVGTSNTALAMKARASAASPQLLLQEALEDIREDFVEPKKAVKFIAGAPSCVAWLTIP